MAYGLRENDLAYGFDLSLRVGILGHASSLCLACALATETATYSSELRCA